MKMNFGGAIEALKNGKKVTRDGWNGKGMFLWLKSATVVKSEWCKDPILKEISDNNGGEVEALGTVCMRTADGKVLTGWLASQSDMLSEDWSIVDENEDNGVETTSADPECGDDYPTCSGGICGVGGGN